MRPDYGIDAPGLVRGFLAAGLLMLAVSIVCVLHRDGHPAERSALWLGLSIGSGIAAVYLLGMGAFMVRYSRVEKRIECERLLDLLPWSGTEQVLDLGCGRGVMLIGAAKRLNTGHATGVDLWLARDQSGNQPAAALENAAIEGVSDRVSVQTADLRQLPFADQHFDVVVSNWALHNLGDRMERAAALDEALRVLKPGGWLLINDIANHAEYADHLAARGIASLHRHRDRWRETLHTAISFGSFAPAAVTARKSC